jgi:hypothetical protein
MAADWISNASDHPDVVGVVGLLEEMRNEKWCVSRRGIVEVIGEAVALNLSADERLAA